MIYRNNTRRFLVPALLLALVLFGNLPFTSSASAPAVPPAVPLLPQPGAVVAWGANFSGQLNVPAGLDDAVAISAGDSFSLALKSDGTVVGWGSNDFGEATPPAGLSNVLAISAGNRHSLALRALSRPTNKNQCKNGGWQTFTEPSFRNQGDCVSFVNHQNHGNN